MSFLWKLLLASITEAQIGAWAEELNRFVLRAWAAAYTAGLTWVLAWWRGGDVEPWLQMTESSETNQTLTIGTLFAIVSAVQYAIAFFRRVRS